MKIFNQKNNFESEITEQGLGTLLGKADDFTTLKAQRPQAAKAIDDIVAASTSGLGKPIITKNGTKITTSEELAIALRDFTLAPKELGRVEKGFLKSASTDGDLRRVIATKFAKDKSVLDELAKYNYNTIADIKKHLSSKYYHKSSIDEIIKQMKANGAIDAKGLLVKNAGKVANTSGKVASKKFGTKIKELLTNIKIKKMSWKRLLVWGTTFSIGAAALWYLIKENSDVIPDGMPTTPPTDDWGPCLNYMIKNQGARVKQSPTQGMVVTTVPNSEYPGGIQFFATGRMVNLQTKDMGTWKCVGGQAQTNENMGKTQVNESIGQLVKRVLNERYLMEQQIDNELNSDVEDMVDYLDVPVWGNDYVNIYNLLKKYSTNGKYKQFANLYQKTGVIGNDTLSGDIRAIKTIDAAPAQMKDNILALLNQIESGKVVSSTTNTNTNTGSTGFKMTTLKEQELQMSWDKDRKPGGGGGSTTTRKTYYDCTNVNIDTTPLTYGCKSPKIAEIQKCLGVGVDGKFGPNTRKALIAKSYDMSNGITKDIYNKVLAACNPSTSQTAGSTEGGADVKYLRTPIKLDSVDLPKIPSANTSSSASGTQGMTGEEYYTSLKDQGLINVMNFLGRRKVAYNGPVLGQSDIQRLNDFLEGRSYYQTNDDKYKLTDAGEKYVWIQQ